MRKQNQNKNINKRQRNSQNRGPRKGSGNAVRPPQFQPTCKFNHKFRFLCTAGGTVTVTRANLLNLLCVATSPTAADRIIEAIRLRSIEIWSSPPALGSAPLSVSVEWVGSNAPSIINSDTSMGVLPAHVRTTPPPRSSDEWWSMSGTDETDPLFTLILPVQSIVDVRVAVRLIDNEPQQTTSEILAGATLGRVYYDYLDGISSGLLLPVGGTVVP
jgi:hypothetical protein